MKIQRTQWIAQGAVIAALYVVLTLLANALGLAGMAIQVRFSEALTVLPYMTSAAVPGLFLGCLISNLLIGAMLPDVIFGSLATLLGAVGTYLIGAAAVKRNGYNGRYMNSKLRWLAPIPPIAANAMIIPYLLAYVYRLEGGLPYFFVTVGIGEVISCGILGMGLLSGLKNHGKLFHAYTR